MEFGRTHEQFLRMTPRQLNSLIEVHAYANEPDEKKRRTMSAHIEPAGPRINVTPDQAPAILQALKSQKPRG